MNVEAVRALIRRRSRQAGTAAAFAKEIGVSYELVRMVVNGKRSPTGKLLATLGLERVVSYRRTSPPQGESGRKRRGGA